MSATVHPEIHRVTALASRAKTRIKNWGQRGLTDASEEEIFAMAYFCNLVLEDYPGSLIPGAPDLSLVPAQTLEEPDDHAA
ncbi:MAG: hypothetical protein MK098_15005 [Marinovum sp.]|nr:hypothetical protein [Marinovum sp.]